MFVEGVRSRHVVTYCTRRSTSQGYDQATVLRLLGSLRGQSEQRERGYAAHIVLGGVVTSRARTEDVGSSQAAPLGPHQEAGA